MSSTDTSVVLKVGDTAPKFSLPSHPNGTVSLDDYIGKKNVVLAFYPKDDTPGCTKEMCAFSEDLSKFNSHDTQVFGVSCDSVKSHEGFTAKYNLKQTLLADTDGKIGKLYGTITEGKSNSSRMLFIIDKQGKIQYIHSGMPDNQEILEQIKKLK
jgi:peroxiredoxin Q/BCP